ncbi:MAG: chemotaxis response regulator protein-glutamate methylesterase [Pseudomonadota bacterium]
MGVALFNSIRVLVVDDSPSARQLLRGILESEPDIEVVGVAVDAYDAREKIKLLKPDVITLDVEMPQMDGITFLANLMRLRPMPVVMISRLAERNSALVQKAMELGAVSFIEKPAVGRGEELKAAAEIIIDEVRNAAAVNLNALSPQGRTSSVNSVPVMTGVFRQPTKSLAPGLGDPLIAIGASTGGTEAIKDIVSRLPSNAPPIVVAQHIPDTFSRSFAERLDELSKMKVYHAEHGQKIERGCVYVAPGSHHLRVARDRSGLVCTLDDSERVGFHRPSVNVLFASVAKARVQPVVAVILTGMGRDGAEGMKQLQDSGAVTIAQDEASCVIYGMPKAAVEEHAIQHVLSLNEIGSELIRMSANELRAA